MYGRQNLMLDFHGCSVEQARNNMDYYLQLALDIGLQELRIVTGRGNHVNARGERAALYHDLPVYLERSPYRDRVERCEPRDGHYVLYLKAKGPNNQSDAEYRRTREMIYQTQLESIKSQSDAGDPFFMTVYAEILERGECGLPQNFPLAASLYHKAALKGFYYAMHQYARCCLHGVGVKQSDPLAVEWAEKAHKEGCLESTLSLARWKYNGLPNYPEDEPEGLKLFQLAIERGSTDAMTCMATIHGSAKRYKDAFELYKRAADLGDVIAQYNTAAMYANGNGVDKNEAQFLHYLMLAARGGDPDAQCELGKKYLSGEGVRCNKETGFNLIMLAANNGSSEACHLVGKWSDTKDDAEYLQRSARAGNIVDQLRLAALKSGSKEPLNLDSIQLSDVLPIFRNTRENGLTMLQHESKFIIFDLVLLHGQGSDKRKAYRLIDQMADSGCVYSIRRKVHFYLQGDSCLNIKKNIPQVVEMLKLCIEGEDAIAMVMLAKMHLRGKGCVKSAEKALLLFQLAAKLHYPPAFYHMGRLYEQKLVKDSSYEKAHQCYILAVKLESEPGKIAHFKYGPIDGYEIITELANQSLARIQSKIKITAKALPPLLAEQAVPQVVVEPIPKSPHALTEEQHLVTELHPRGAVMQAPEPSYDIEQSQYTIVRNRAALRPPTDQASQLPGNYNDRQHNSGGALYSFFNARNAAFVVGAAVTFALTAYIRAKP